MSESMWIYSFTVVNYRVLSLNLVCHAFFRYKNSGNGECEVNKVVYKE